jgi:hypothetical protein
MTGRFEIPSYITTQPNLDIRWPRVSRKDRIKSKDLKKTHNHNEQSSQTGGFEGFGRFGDLRLISRRFRRLTILVAISR